MELAEKSAGIRQPDVRWEKKFTRANRPNKRGFSKRNFGETACGPGAGLLRVEHESENCRCQALNQRRNNSCLPVFTGFSALRNRSVKNMELPFLGAEQELNVGTYTVIESDSPNETRGVVFEDDGETGYFYARDYAEPDRFFVDALHIYNSQGVSDRDKPCRVKIVWTRDFTAVALLINLVPHAVFNFDERCGYAKSPYPAADPSTGWTHSNEILKTRDLFFPKQTNIEPESAGGTAH